MANSELHNLVQEKESPKLEFKQEWYSGKNELDGKGWGEFLKDIISLTNGNIGYYGQAAHLVIGASDKDPSPTEVRETVNVPMTRLLSDLQKLRDMTFAKLKNVCIPSVPDLFFEWIKFAAKKELLVISVPPPSSLIVLSRDLETRGKTYDKGAVLIRVGHDTAIVSPADIEGLNTEIKKNQDASTGREIPYSKGQIVDMIKQNFITYSQESMRVKIRASQLDNHQKMEVIEAILTDLDGLKSTSLEIIAYISKFFPDTYEKFWRNQKNGDILFSILKDGPINESWVKDIRANRWNSQPRDLKNALCNIFGFSDDLLDFVWEHFINEHLTFAKILNDNEKMAIIFIGRVFLFILPILLLIWAYATTNLIFIFVSWIYAVITWAIYARPWFSYLKQKRAIIQQEKVLAKFKKEHPALYWLKRILG